MIKASIKYFILCAVFLIGLFLISLNFGSNPLLDSRHFWFDLGIFLLFIFFAAKEYKDFRNDGYLHFWQGISIGFIVMIPSLLIFCLFLFLLFQSDPTFIDVYYRDGARLMIEPKKEFLIENFGAESIDEEYRLIDERTSLEVIFRHSFWKLLTAFLIIPVVAIILRRKP